MKVKSGSKVKVEYEGRLESGEVFDSSSHGDHSHPLEFEVDSGTMIKGFNDGVLDMEVGQEKEITIEAKDAYGETSKDMVKEFPRSMLPPLPDGKEPKKGMTLMLSSQNGHQFPAKITKITKEKVTLDLNHPLAGKKLIFKIKLVELN